MDRKRATAPEIEGYVASRVSILNSWNGSGQAWQYHHASDWRPDGRKVRVYQSLDTGKVSLWRDETDAHRPLDLHDPTDAEIVAAARDMALGHVVDMSSDAASLPDRTASQKLIEAGLDYGDYLGGAAWCKHEGRIMHAILALDGDGKQVVDFHNAPTTYPDPDRPVAVVVSWNLNDAFPIVGHETVAPNLDAAIELVRRGAIPLPDIAEHGWDEDEIERVEAGYDNDRRGGVKAYGALVKRIKYERVDFDFAELARGSNPSP